MQRTCNVLADCRESVRLNEAFDLFDFPLAAGRYLLKVTPEAQN